MHGNPGGRPALESCADAGTANPMNAADAAAVTTTLDRKPRETIFCAFAESSLLPRSSTAVINPCHIFRRCGAVGPHRPVDLDACVNTVGRQRIRLHPQAATAIRERAGYRST